MVLYDITLIPLVEELRSAYPGLIFPFYTDEAEFDRSDRRSVQLVKMLLEQGMDWG